MAVFFRKFIKLLARKIPKKKHNFFLSFSVGFAALMFCLVIFQFASIDTVQGKVLGTKTKKTAYSSTIYTQTNITPTLTLLKPTVATPTPTSTPTPVPAKPKPTPTPISPTVSSPSSQYTAEQIGENTFRIKNVPNDGTMATPKEIFDAINSYRQSRGAGQLTWDDKLGDLANSRVNTFASLGNLDSHAGFRDFMNNGGFATAGFNGLGENSAKLSGPMSGERIIREIFGADAPHDTNQLNPEWTHAAAAVNGIFVNVNFGKGKR